MTTTVRGSIKGQYGTVAEAIADRTLKVGQNVKVADTLAEYDVVGNGTGVVGGGEYLDTNNSLQLKLIEQPFTNTIKYGGTFTLYVSPAGNDSNQGTVVTEPFLTIQKAVDTLQSVGSFISGEADIVLAAGTYPESVALDSVINTDTWWNIRGPEVTGARVPTAILEGGGTLANGFSLQNTRVRFYDVKCQNYTAYGFTPSNQSITQLHNCHGTGCGIAGVNAEIQVRMWLYGGLYEGNTQFGARFYSDTTGSIRVDSRVADSTQYARFNNNASGIQVREYSNVRGDDFICDGNSVSSVQVTNARMHLANPTLDNCPLGVDAQRKGEWFDDNITYGAGIVEKYRNYGGALELQDFKARFNEIISLVPSNIIHTGVTADTEIYNVYEVVADTFNRNTKQFTLKGWADLSAASGTATVKVKLGPTVLSERVFPVSSTGAMEYEVYIRADNSNLQTVRSKYLRSLQQDILGQSKLADNTITSNLTVTCELSDASDSVTFYGCHLHRIT